MDLVELKTSGFIIIL